MEHGTIKCTLCESKRYCRKHNISRDSSTCEIRRGVREPKKNDEPSDQAKGMAMIGHLMGRK